MQRRQTGSTRGVRNLAEEADRKYEDVSQEFCRGGRQEVRGCESGILQRRENSNYEELSQKSCRGGGWEVRGGDSEIMHRIWTGSTRS
jgi:outer membrane protein assembly factor BamA